MGDQPEVPSFIRDLLAACDDMSDPELMMALGPILTVLCKRMGPARLRSAVLWGIKVAEENLSELKG